MNVTVIAGKELSEGHLARWGEIQRSDGTLASPFLCPEFTILAAAACRGVRVGIMEQGGHIVGFFPFQRFYRVIGRPVAYTISDCQGVVVGPDVRWSAEELLSACGLSVFEFNHLLACQSAFGAYQRKQGTSPVINLAGGYEAYRKERREAGSEQLKKLENLARRMERELGPLRFEAQVADATAFKKLVELKLSHDLEKGYKGVLAVGWVREMVERIHQTRTDGFAGMLSALYAGEELVAVHMGMRSRTVWHYWMPAYEPRHAKLSPGLILLMRMAQAAPGLGITTIDMGKGQMDYKERFMNGSVPLAEGRVCMSRLVAAVADGVRQARVWMGRMRDRHPGRAAQAEQIAR
jgi:CelD/BcsL family acetyltransferase involved in cellulose biosynthesis